MKKIVIFLLFGFIVLGLSGCSSNTTSTEMTNTENASIVGTWEFEGMNEAGDYVTVSLDFENENDYTLNFVNSGTENTAENQTTTTVSGEYVISDQSIDLSITSTDGDTSALNPDFSDSKATELEYNLEDSDTLIILDMGNALSSLNQEIALTR